MKHLDCLTHEQAAGVRAKPACACFVPATAGQCQSDADTIFIKTRHHSDGKAMRRCAVRPGSDCRAAAPSGTRKSSLRSRSRWVMSCCQRDIAGPIAGKDMPLNASSARNAPAAGCSQTSRTRSTGSRPAGLPNRRIQTPLAAPSGGLAVPASAGGSQAFPRWIACFSILKIGTVFDSCFKF